MKRFTYTNQPLQPSDRFRLHWRGSTSCSCVLTSVLVHWFIVSSITWRNADCPHLSLLHWIGRRETSIVVARILWPEHLHAYPNCSISNYDRLPSSDENDGKAWGVMGRLKEVKWRISRKSEITKELQSRYVEERKMFTSHPHTCQWRTANF